MRSDHRHASGADLLRALPVGSLLPSDRLVEIGLGLDVIEVAPGEVVVRRGQPVEDCFLVARGRARRSAGRRVVGVLVPGDVVGDELARRPGQAAPETVVAEEPMVVLVADHRALEALLACDGVADALAVRGDRSR